MRLLHVNTLDFTEFRNDRTPKYIIVSHRWDEGFEVTLQDVQNRWNTHKSGYKKIEDFAKYVKKNNPEIEWLWIDTCCINKDSAAELSEAINLMFEWYRNAEKCVAYLADVPSPEDKRSFEESEWFWRGWTLQELLAPRLVVFVTRSWQVIGNKGTSEHGGSGTFIGPGLEKEITRITKIPEQALHEFNASGGWGVEERLKWMKGRSTTREEDMSYALYGIFGVTPGANYGEKRDGARRRLLAAIHHEEDVSTRQAERFQKIADWLSPPDPWTNHKLARAQHEPQTGAWLLDCDDYRDWKSASNRHLWVYGKAGCGKTMLCSTAIEDVKTHCDNTARVGYAIFYFSFSDKKKQRYEDVLLSVVVQLGWRAPGLSMLQQAYDKPNRSLPGLDELEKILLACAQSYDELFLLVDALDECPEDSDVRHNVLQGLARLSEKALHLHILATSRELPDIRDSMMTLGAKLISIDTNAVDADIRLYTSTQLSRHHRLSRLDRTTKALIEELISVKADGMFRWAYCQLQELKDLKSTRPKFVKEALYSLPATLDETYERMLIRIDENLRVDALTLLRWLAYAKSPPSLGELVEATVINLTAEGAVEVEDRPGLGDSLEILSGLVTIIGDEESKDGRDHAEDVGRYKSESEGGESEVVGHRRRIRENNKVRLAHFSIKEYLESKRILKSEAKDFYLESGLGHRFLACSCLVYLLHYSRSSEKMSGRQDFVTFPLLEYAAQAWYHHSSIHQVGQAAYEMSLLTSENAMRDWLLVHLPDRVWEGSFVRREYTTSGLYYASFLGLGAVVMKLLERGADINAQGGLYGNALQAASAGGHEKLVKVLLERGADIDAQGGRYSNALQAASDRGDEKVVRMLMKAGAVSS